MVHYESKEGSNLRAGILGGIMKVVVCMIIVAALTASLAGCHARVGLPSKSPDSNEIVSKLTSVLAKVKHLRLDGDFTDNLTGANSDSFKSMTEWNGTTEIDFTRQSAHTTSRITGLIDYNIEIYFVRGWQYLKSTPPGPSWSGSHWTKTQVEDRTWARVTQLSFYLEVLNTAQIVVLAGSDNMSNVDYYVLDVTPSPMAMIDWIVAQELPVGPQIDTMNGGRIPLVRADAYRQGNLRLWIDKESYRISKAQINARFEGSIGGWMITTVPNTSDGKFVERFEATVYFYGYDDTTRITLPADVHP
jgi:hypothetical protein